MSGSAQPALVQSRSIGDLPIHIGDGNYSSKYPKSTDFLPSGVPFITASDLVNGKIRTDNFRFIALEQHNKLKKGHLKSGDVLIVTRGNDVGGLAFVDQEFEGCNINAQLVLLRADESELHCRFLYYLLSSPAYQTRLRTSVTGSAQPQIPIWSLKSVELAFPSYSEQKAIAHILGTLDDKIELNRRMNATLEAMARALFQSWFVDLVQNGRPTGWREGTLGDVSENPRRGVNPNEIELSTPYIGLEHMPRRCIALSDWGYADELESDKFEFKHGEILFGKLRPYFHKVGVAPLDGVCSTDILVVRPKEPSWFGFVLGHVSSVELVNHTNAASTGTKMPRTNWNDIARFEVALPPEQLAEEFNERIRPTIDRIIANTHESLTLAALRDTLLPKLLSGELSVSK